MIRKILLLLILVPLLVVAGTDDWSGPLTVHSNALVTEMDVYAYHDQGFLPCGSARLMPRMTVLLGCGHKPIKFFRVYGPLPSYAYTPASLQGNTHFSVSVSWLGVPYVLSK